MTKSNARAAGAAPDADEERPPRGRRPKLTHALTDALCAALSTGAPITVCVKANGFDRSTYYDWLDTGLDDLEAGRRTVHGYFADRVPQAMAKGELSYWAIIAEAARSASAKDKDGKPAHKPAVVAAKVAAAKVALAALRTRWGKRYKSYSETKNLRRPGEGGGGDEDMPPPLPPPEEVEEGEFDFKRLPAEERRELVRLMRKARGLAEG